MMENISYLLMSITCFVFAYAHFKGNVSLVHSYHKRKIKQAILYSLAIGIPATIFFMILPELPLKLIYHTNEGISYIRFLAPICLFQYIQSPLSSALDAMGKSKDTMVATTIGVFMRSIFLVLLSLLKIGLWGLIIAISLNVLAVTFYSIKKVRYHLTI